MQSSRVKRRSLVQTGASGEQVTIPLATSSSSRDVVQGLCSLSPLPAAPEAPEAQEEEVSAAGAMFDAIGKAPARAPPALPAVETVESFGGGDLANEPTGDLFSRFVTADTAELVMGTYAELKARADVQQPAEGMEHPYQQIKRLEGLPWRARAVWALLDQRVALAEYRAAPLAGRRAVVCGAGPCGIRVALELALLRADVLVVEKRRASEAFCRVNRLHIWEWCKVDLLSWGAKIFDPPCSTFGSDNDFCHIGIGELQLLLLKSALLLGVRLEFVRDAKEVADGALVCKDGSRLPCDTLLVADGANSLLGRALGLKPVVVGLRGRGSAIGVVANFVNNRDTSQMALRQFSWARQFNMPLFTDLKEKCGINLENCVYYKGSSRHYMVMTPTKQSLLEAQILNENHASSRLLHRDNVDLAKLTSMLERVAGFFGLPTELCESQGAMIFDFSGVRRLESAAAQAGGVFCVAVGDALLEPFWPEGLGIMRGFMSALDAASAVTVALGSGGADAKAGDVEAAIEQTNSTYTVLKSVAAQTAVQCLQKDVRKYRLDPKSRYILSHHV